MYPPRFKVSSPLLWIKGFSWIIIIQTRTILMVLFIVKTFCERHSSFIGEMCIVVLCCGLSLLIWLDWNQMRCEIEGELKQQATYSHCIWEPPYLRPVINLISLHINFVFSNTHCQVGCVGYGLNCLQKQKPIVSAKTESRIHHRVKRVVTNQLSCQKGNKSVYFATGMWLDKLYQTKSNGGCFINCN